MAFIRDLARKVVRRSSIASSALASSASPRAPAADQIDVRDLIARYDHAEHARRADAYFEHLLHEPIIRRKPFAHLGEAIQIMTGFAQLMEGAELFPAADVLDFGAGTAWSSRILASVGCRVTALDVSKNALAIGQNIQQADPLSRDLPIEYRVFDGRSIPLADGAVDRVLSFDAFHHVADQETVLNEFARVLREGGIAAFAEPGPRHSWTASSQLEMKAYGVIENDIDVDAIWRMAQAAGFADIKLSFAMPRQTLVPLETFNDILKREAAPDSIVFSPINRALHENRRVFFLYKSHGAVKDSRFAEGLHARLNVRRVEVEKPGVLRVQVEARNTGSNGWLPSGERVGSVNLGVHLRATDGTMIENDFARLHVSGRPVAPGQSVEISDIVILPTRDDFILDLDLVAEAVTWFEIRGVQPISLRFQGGRYVS